MSEQNAVVRAPLGAKPSVAQDGDRSDSSKTESRRNVLVLLFAGFFLSGIAITVVGPMLPIFIKRWALNDSQASVFSILQFAAGLGGTLASSLIVAKSGFRPALVIGYALVGGGLAFLNSSSHGVALAATTAFGLGYGLITPGTNLFVAELGGARSAPLLNQLNFAWGAGAMSCSPLVALALRHNAVGSMLIGTAIMGAVLVLGLSFASFGEQRHEKVVGNGAASIPAMGLAVTIALAGMFFIYVAMENGIGIWAAEYAKRLANGITSLTTLAPMFFYAGLTLGRGSASFVLRRVHERPLVLGALSLTAAAIALLIGSKSLLIATPAIFLAGLGCAAVYPIFIAWLSRWYGAQAKKIGGVLFAIATLGGSAGSGLIGTFSQYSGSLRVGYVVPLACAIALIGLVLALRRQATV
jgi:MFS transporter, FHS family, glucose/mannose:H+ symporter